MLPADTHGDLLRAQTEVVLQLVLKDYLAIFNRIVFRTTVLCFYLAELPFAVKVGTLFAPIT